MQTNVLYYGDNLDILRHHIPDESIDLIYLDPPFNSQATYNVLFREESGAVTPRPVEAFQDTWHCQSLLPLHQQDHRRLRQHPVHNRVPTHHRVPRPGTLS